MCMQMHKVTFMHCLVTILFVLLGITSFDMIGCERIVTMVTMTTSMTECCKKGLFECLDAKCKYIVEILLMNFILFVHKDM